MNLDNLLDIAKKAAVEAGKDIISIYESANFEVEQKGDNSPLTRADKAAHEKIQSILKETELPLLSEEGKDIPFEERKDWDYFWMVDPLDGTKEFIKRNGEFTVNIALIHQNKPVLGVVYTPVLKKLYYGVQGQGASLIDLNAGEEPVSIQTVKEKPEVTKVVASRSHMNDETKNFIQDYEPYELVSMGSSLKLIMVAEGQAHLYPRIAPTMEWDTAAAQIVVEEAGGQVLNFETKEPMGYNKENLLNSYFVVYPTPQSN